MRRSKRKVESKYGSRTVRKHSFPQKSLRDTLLTAHSSVLSDRTVFDNLLRACIMRMLPHVWVKILPSSDLDVDNFSFSIGQDWELIKMLFIRLNLLKKYKNELRLNILKFEELQLVKINGVSINIGSSHIRNEKKVYYICYDVPVYVYPWQQIQQKYSYACVQYYNRTDQILKKLLSEHLELNTTKDTTNITLSEGSKTLATSINLIDTAEAVPPSEIITIEKQIESALALNLVLFPRFHRLRPSQKILLNKGKQATSKEKLLLLINAWKWGYNCSQSTFEQKCRILKGSSRLVAYDNGYAKEFSLRSIQRWESLALEQVMMGLQSEEIVGRHHKGSVSCTDAVDKKYPGYLHSLFRKALQVKGNNASFSEISCHMNVSSSLESESRDSVQLSRKQIEVWFKTHSGKLMSPVEKPLDSPEHCVKRIDWVINNYGLLTNPYSPVCYIDEKWFYRVNRRRAIKVLPKNDFELDNVEIARKGKMLSRRFPIKTMFMGVVGRPIPHREFDGKIFMERVSRTKFVTTATAHTNFSDDALVNDAIKKGDWRLLVDDIAETVEDLSNLLTGSYNLEESIIDRLEFYYITKIGGNGNTKKVVLEDDDISFKTKLVRVNNDKAVAPRLLTLNDVHVQVRNLIGDPVQIDCTCDSEYMTEAMKRVGESIRNAYHWIPMSQPCWLVMDNTGGHGTEDVIDEHCCTSKER